MAKNRERDINDSKMDLAKALIFMAITFISFIAEKSAQGFSMKEIMKNFVKQKKNIINSTLVTVGLAGGGIGAFSIWISSLGWVSSILYSIGFLTVPFWIVPAGSVVGLTFVGGIIYKLNRKIKKNNEKLICEIVFSYGSNIIDKSRENITKSEFEKYLNDILKPFNFKDKELKEIFNYKVEGLRKIVRELNPEERQTVLKLIFPIVYLDGEFTKANKEYLKSILDDLEINVSEIEKLDIEFNQNLDKMWKYHNNTFNILSDLNSEFKFNDEEIHKILDTYKEVLEFDPRLEASKKKEVFMKNISYLSKFIKELSPHKGIKGAAELISAYAIAEASILNKYRKMEFNDQFNQLLNSDPNIDGKTKSEILKGVDDINSIYDDLKNATKEE